MYVMHVRLTQIWSLSGNNFTKDDIFAVIEHLCTVWCPAHNWTIL